MTIQSYYSEGFGVVKHRVLINEETISYYQLKSFDIKWEKAINYR